MRGDEQTGPRDRRDRERDAYDDEDDGRLGTHRGDRDHDNHFSTNHDDDRAGRTWGGMNSKREHRDGRFTGRGVDEDDEEGHYRARDTYDDHHQEADVHFARDPRFGVAHAGPGHTHDLYAGERYQHSSFRPVEEMYRGFVRSGGDFLRDRDLYGDSDRYRPGGYGRDEDAYNMYGRDPRDDANRFPRRRRF